MTSADAGALQSPPSAAAQRRGLPARTLATSPHQPRTNLLLADDVGLGKTIEAGLVVQELLLRHRARTVVIVCPPSLSLKWQDEMREKFGLDFVIVDSALMAEVRRSLTAERQPVPTLPSVIISMAWLSPSPRAQRLLRDVLADTRHTASRGASPSTSWSSTRRIMSPRRVPSVVGGGRGYAVDSLRTIATARSPNAASTGSFLSATRTTVTPSRSPPCSR